MIKRILFIVALLGLISCEKQNFNEDKMTYEAIQLLRKLEVAYKNSSTKDIDSFFLEWEKSVSQSSNDVIDQNEVIKSIFIIFKEFYAPSDLKKLGDWEWDNMNAGYEYVVVQNTIYYYVSSNDIVERYSLGIEQYDTITNFKPPVNTNLGKVLYLTDEYRKAINTFLGSESTGVGVGSIMNPSMPVGESQKRYEFLRKYIQIIPGHWGGDWHIATHPEVINIVFNNTLDEACINFRVGYMGGEAMFSKEGAKWVLKSSRATWIE